jgi:Tfp pilus assembly protein PilE
MVHCRGCGQQIHESAVTCPHCGAPQGTPATGSAAASAGPLPDGVRGWSWGAFLFNWLWAVFNGVWIGLLALVPFVGFVMMFVLGVKGREWAWRSKQWDSVEHFQRVQRKWSVWAVGLWVVPTVILVVVSIALPSYRGYVERSKAATAQVQQRELEVAAAAERESADAAARQAAEQAARQSAKLAAEQAAEQAARQAAAQSASSTVAEAAVATTTPAPAAPTTVSAAPAPDLLLAARGCTSALACAQLMLEGALPRRADVVQAAATSIGKLPRPEQGDRKIARDLNKRALEQFNNGSYAAAAPLLRQAASADPSDVEIKSNLGLALVRAGSPRDAEAALLAALELDPRRSSAWVPLAEALDAQSNAGAALRALLLAYEFSANKQRTLEYFRGRTEAAEVTEGQRALFAKALGSVEAGY